MNLFAITWVLVFVFGASAVPIAEFSGPNAMADCVANGKRLGETETFRRWAAVCLPIERTR